MDKRRPVNALLQTAGRVVVGGIFAAAAGLKLADRAAFLVDIRHYDLVGETLAQVVAAYLPWLELVCACGLLVRRWERAAAFLTAGLCGIFATLTAITWIRGIDVACGCFGHTASVGHPALTLARDLLLGCLAGLSVRRTAGSRCDEDEGERNIPVLRIDR